jgi:hypothetical protein
MNGVNFLFFKNFFGEELLGIKCAYIECKKKIMIKFDGLLIHKIIYHS